MQFFIKHDNTQDGPFDLVTMVRKIRNGAIAPDVLVLETDDPAAVPACEHPQLKTFFREIELLSAREESGGATNFGFSHSLKRGMAFLSEHHSAVIFAGGALCGTLLLGTLLGFLLPGFLSVLNILLAWMFGQFLVGILMFGFLRMHRGQTSDVHSLKPILQRYVVPLAFCASLMGIFTFLGMFLLIVPGLVLLAFYSFAPLLIIDQNYDFWQAMETSRKTILRHGRPLFEIVFGFALINFFAGACFILPLALTLPVTYGALAALYDEIKFED